MLKCLSFIIISLLCIGIAMADWNDTQFTSENSSSLFSEAPQPGDFNQDMAFGLYLLKKALYIFALLLIGYISLRIIMHYNKKIEKRLGI
jgi:hypothetical protein